MPDLRKKFCKMMDIYYDIKEEIQIKDKYLYERWKVGGFLVDPSIASMYPDIEKAVEEIEYNETMEQLDGEEDE